MHVAGLCLLLWNLLIHLAGIYLFTRGFLLTRLSLPNISSPSDFPTHQPNFTLLNASLTQQHPPLQTHTRAIFLLIDSLRFDFISPHPPSPPSPFHHNVLTLPRDLTATRPRHSFIFNAYSDPPTTTLQRIKALMTGTLPTFVDIGGSLGGGGDANENRTEVAEDSVLKQLDILGKKVAFMGDDTWLSVFPSSFSKNLTFPFDSFNVEDLHTVDEGVISHLFPLLDSSQPPKFDLLIAHFLGVDHVGHRLGPDHPSMKQKLSQMNDVLKRVVDRMDPSTLLIVLGDHGMDRSGDHGGDGVLETSAGMWIYSKGPALMNSTLALPNDLLTYQTFPGTSVPHRSIQQIDILPTLSLLLGLPIPYNNLGSVIPELFWRDRKGGRILEKALEANARQAWRFLETYRASRLGGELDEVWEDLVREWEDTSEKAVKQAAARAARLRLRSHSSGSSSSSVKNNNKKKNPNAIGLSLSFLDSTRRALAACRAIWAQFNPLLMSLGLTILVMWLMACWRVYAGYSAAVIASCTRVNNHEQRNGNGLVVVGHHHPEDKASLFSSSLAPERYLTTILLRSLLSSILASIIGGFVAYFGLTMTRTNVSFPHWIVFFASWGSSLGFLIPCDTTTNNTTSLVRLSLSGWKPNPSITRSFQLSFSSLPIILILHSITFVSNSFTFWEERLLPFLLLSSLLPYLRLALHPALSSSSPSSTRRGENIRTHLLLSLTLLTLSIRLIAQSTVCREEQQPYCTVTFFQASSVPQPPWIVVGVLMGLVLGACWVLVRGFGCGFGNGFGKDGGIVEFQVRYVVLPTLMAGTLFWVVEWVDSAGLLAVVVGGGGGGDSTTTTSISMTVMLSYIGSVARWVGLETTLVRTTTWIESVTPEDLRVWRTKIAWGGVGWLLMGGAIGCCRWLWSIYAARGKEGGRDDDQKRNWVSPPPPPPRPRWYTPYLILWTTTFALVYLCTQLTGQVVLLLSTVALVSFGEVVRCARLARVLVGEVEKERETCRRGGGGDSNEDEDDEKDDPKRPLPPPPPSASEDSMIKFTDLTPLSLLSLLTFYATGHQANVPSIQWKAAFVLCDKVQYPLSVVTMVLNEFGGLGVVVLGVGGVVVVGGGADGWGEEAGEGEAENLSAVPRLVDGHQQEQDHHTHTLLLSLLSLSTHFLVLLLGSSVGAAILRRHLMVWKVFAPRFMAAVVDVLVVDLVVVVLGVGLVGVMCGGGGSGRM